MSQVIFITSLGRMNLGHQSYLKGAKVYAFCTNTHSSLSLYSWYTKTSINLVTFSMIMTWWDMNWMNLGTVSGSFPVLAHSSVTFKSPCVKDIPICLHLALQPFFPALGKLILTDRGLMVHPASFVFAFLSSLDADILPVVILFPLHFFPLSVENLTWIFAFLLYLIIITHWHIGFAKIFLLRT